MLLMAHKESFWLNAKLFYCLFLKYYSTFIPKSHIGANCKLKIFETIHKIHGKQSL